MRSGSGAQPCTGLPPIAQPLRLHVSGRLLVPLRLLAWLLLLVSVQWLRLLRLMLRLLLPLQLLLLLLVPLPPLLALAPPDALRLLLDAPFAGGPAR